MASDVIESDSALKGDMSVDNGTPHLVAPRRTRAEHGHTSSSSSSGVSGDGDEEELEDWQNREETLPVTKTSGFSQEKTPPNNERTPVSLPQPRSPPGPIGR